MFHRQIVPEAMFRGWLKFILLQGLNMTWSFLSGTLATCSPRGVFVDKSERIAMKSKTHVGPKRSEIHFVFHRCKVSHELQSIQQRPGVSKLQSILNEFLKNED